MKFNPANGIEKRAADDLRLHKLDLILVLSYNFAVEVRYFRQGQREPVREYMDEMAEHHPDAAAKMRTRIDLLAAEGTMSKNISCRNMGQGLWELKVRSAVGTHRVFFGIVDGVILLLHAFTKKSKKTPKFELETARRRLKEVDP